MTKRQGTFIWVLGSFLVGFGISMVHIGLGIALLGTLLVAGIARYEINEECEDVDTK